jgi:shikimate dehydrogenase
MSRELNFKQELTACFGQPVSENPTQVMIEAAYKYHRLEWRYLTIEVAPDRLADAVQGARAMGFAGFNCTIPHKVAVIEHLDGLGESAGIMGAVNCVVRRGNELIGENTDGKGFLKSIREVVDPTGKRVVIFGAGGAARAISVELALAGAQNFELVNRSPKRGVELAELLRSKLGASVEFVPSTVDYKLPENCDLVINATSVGLYPNGDARVGFDITTLRPDMVVADVIPNPPETQLVREARKIGCKVIDGLGMLVNQGVIGIKHWTGVDPDSGVMRRALEDIFAA